MSNKVLLLGEVTAEHTLVLLLADMRKLTKADAELKLGKWDRKSNQLVQAFGQKVGIVGLGRIGRYVAQLLNAIGMQVYAYDPMAPNYHFIRSRVARVESLDELISSLNYLSINTPRDTTTMNMINSDHIDKLAKPNGIVNTGRGGIVNGDVIIEALKLGALDFYGTDVFNSEPNPNPELIRQNVIATPHTAANSAAAQHQVALDIIMQLQEVLQSNAPPSYLVNSSHV